VRVVWPLGAQRRTQPRSGGRCRRSAARTSRSSTTTRTATRSIRRWTGSRAR